MYLADTGCKIYWIEVPCKGKVVGFCVYKGREFLASRIAVSLSDSIWYRLIVFE